MKKFEELMSVKDDIENISASEAKEKLNVCTIQTTYTGSFVMLCQTLEAQNTNKNYPWG